MLVIVKTSSGQDSPRLKNVNTLEQAIEELSTEVNEYGVILTKETYWTVEIYDTYRE